MIPVPDLGTRRLRLEVDGTDFSDAVSTVKITAADTSSDFVSFLSASLGGARDYSLSLKLVQNTDAASLWHYIWAEAGSEVPVIIWPNGGSVPSVNTPKVTGTVVIAESDDLLGGDADKSVSARFTVDCSWSFTSKPTLAIA